MPQYACLLVKLQLITDKWLTVVCLEDHLYLLLSPEP